mmetsp:Transcript_17724/g.49459  ORF Transcript_17724/g.49459 Transcript_17724/m.49459 type:complete len:119 (-) Transcript_17724:2633-2989(-)|eukprot:1152448-Pelagomonas_calceolata.AAC.5
MPLRLSAYFNIEEIKKDDANTSIMHTNYRLKVGKPLCKGYSWHIIQFHAALCSDPRTYWNIGCDSLCDSAFDIKSNLESSLSSQHPYTAMPYGPQKTGQTNCAASVWHITMNIAKEQD